MATANWTARLDILQPALQETCRGNSEFRFQSPIPELPACSDRGQHVGALTRRHPALQRRHAGVDDQRTGSATSLEIIPRVVKGCWLSLLSRMYSAFAASRASWASACASSALPPTIVASACTTNVWNGRRSRLNSSCPCLTRSPLWNDSCFEHTGHLRSNEDHGERLDVPMAARSTGTSFDTTLAVTTVAAPP